ncbi:MAG: glycosyltransferase family 4 protein [Nitrospira sp.]|nr:MAG: glycosyltransferase family 4 protein [Nitrospira sp.]
MHNGKTQKVRVLYSFPHKLGADRICYTAWQQVNGLAAAGAEVLAFPGVLQRPVPANVTVNPTLSWGKARISYKLVGTMRACIWHDYIVSRRLEQLAGQVDIVHAWPLGSLRTLRTAARLGIPTVLERPNAHTRFAYEVVQKECERLGVVLPPDHEHAYKEDVLRREEAEYDITYRLLCPSDFVVRTYLERGFERKKLVRHIYGFDEKRFYPDTKPRNPQRGFTMLSVGVCAVRKGLHYALEAWLQSPASNDGTFLIAGDFLPAYAHKLSSMLAHPSVKVLGHRNDVPELMRSSDVLVLPSIEEGFGLVCTEAMGSGCVPLVSDACTDLCMHMENALVHQVGDVSALAGHITKLHSDRTLLEKLRTTGLRAVPEITWNAAGITLLQVYSEVVASYSSRRDSHAIINRVGSSHDDQSTPANNTRTVTS